MPAAIYRFAIFQTTGDFGKNIWSRSSYSFLRAGFVTSTRGAQGGYQLARHPSEYTVGDILRITEGSLAPVACLEHEPIDCARANECITLDFTGADCTM